MEDLMIAVTIKLQLLLLMNEKKLRGGTNGFPECGVSCIRR